MVWSPRRFDPETATAGEWERLLTYLRARHRVAYPDVPPPSDETFRRALAHEPVDAAVERWWVEDGERVLGIGHLVLEASRATLRASVHPDFRRRGLGTAWLRRALEEMDARGSTALIAPVTEDSGHAFARHAGFTVQQRSEVRRLEMDRVDWNRVDRWIGNLQRRAPGFRFVVHEDRVPDDRLEEYCAVLDELHARVPRDEADSGASPTPDGLREAARAHAESGARPSTVLVRDPDGRLVGISETLWRPEAAGFVDLRFTGVRPDVDGRGIGKALKARTLRHVRERFPEVRIVSTANASTNAAILAINDRLGFRLHLEMTTYRIERDDLARHLASAPE